MEFCRNRSIESLPQTEISFDNTQPTTGIGMSTTLDLPQIDYPESDGKPMAETPLHGNLMIDLSFAIGRHFLNDPLTYVARNMFLYYVEGQPKKVIAPDVYFVRGVEKHLRETYKLWVEGVAPQVVFEISSRSTMREDLHKKPRIYELIGVQEYYLFDPTQDYLKDGPFVAFLSCDGKLVEQDVSSNRIYSPALGLDLVVQDGSLRLFDPRTRTLLLTPSEAADAHEQAVIDLKQADADLELAEFERERAECRRERAEADRERERTEREQLEAEVTRLRQEIAALKGRP